MSEAESIRLRLSSAQAQQRDYLRRVGWIESHKLWMHRKLPGSMLVLSSAFCTQLKWEKDA